MTVMKKFFCCCNLETGTVVWGWLGLMGSISSFIGCIITYITSQKSQFHDSIYESLVAGQIVSSILGVIFHSLLIHGTLNKKPLLLLPWLVANAATSFGSTLLVFVGGIVLFCTEFWRFGFVLYLIGFPITGLYVYIWLCIQSTYTKLKDDLGTEFLLLVNK